MKRKEFKKILSILALVIIGGVVGYFIGKMIGSVIVNKSGMSFIAILVLFIPIILFVIAWHEAGHAAAGIKVGFDFRMYVVGPFLWEKQNTSWKFIWNKDINKAGGLVLCLPTDTDNLPRRFMFFAAGGPLSSLLLSGITFTLYWFVTKDKIVQDTGIGVANIGLLLTMAMSFIIFLATAIPSKTGGFYSDGARVVRLLKGGDTTKFEILMMNTIANTTSGIRPKMLNMNQLNEMNEIGIRMNEPFRVYIHSFFHQAAFDRGEIEKAEKHLLDYIKEGENIPEGFRNGVWLDATFFYAFAKKDLNKAEKYWHIFKPSPIIPKAQILATEAILSFLKNDSEIALSKIKTALTEIPNMIDKGVGVALQDKLLALKYEIEN